jgi:hypothetical protein
MRWELRDRISPLDGRILAAPLAGRIPSVFTSPLPMATG